jgi:D-alanyl-D-alanine dipeptidase
VDHFVRWSREPADAAAAARHHPRVPKDELFAAGYIAARSGHSRGSTVDVGLVSGGEPLDFGTPFDFFDPLSHVMRPVLRRGRASRRGAGAARSGPTPRVVALHARGRPWPELTSTSR